jgi:excisionase family DNA binding protein
LSENSKFQPGKVNQTVYMVESRVLMAVFEKRLISVEETAKYLGVQKSTIYSWAWRRKIPSVKMGRRLLFDQEDLDRMIEVGKREAR